MTKKPLRCSECKVALAKIDYQIWGTKKFNQATGNYEEDESLGNTDMQFSCPRCSVKLDPELVLDF